MSDENLWVKFYKHPVHMKFKSEKEGRPIYEDRDFISIIVPGDDTTKIDREVRDDDKERFPVQWRKYQANEEQAVEGTRLEDWPALTASQREELKHMKCFTVEQLANSSDQQCKKMGMGGISLREQAKAFLAVAKDAAAAQHYAAENERLRTQVDELTAQVKELATKVEVLSDKGRKAA